MTIINTLYYILAYIQHKGESHLKTHQIVLFELPVR